MQTQDTQPHTQDTHTQDTDTRRTHRHTRRDYEPVSVHPDTPHGDLAAVPPRLMQRAHRTLAAPPHTLGGQRGRPSELLTPDGQSCLIQVLPTSHKPCSLSASWQPEERSHLISLGAKGCFPLVVAACQDLLGVEELGAGAQLPLGFDRDSSPSYRG